jgi:hypothetical protein
VRALPQTEVYGGLLWYDPAQFDDILMATANFQNTNIDPKAQIETGFVAMGDMKSYYISVLYDHPIVPENTFKEFLDIHHQGTLKTCSYLSLIQATALFVSGSANMR